MAIWILEPLADPDDPRWQSRKQFRAVIVRAETPAFARLAAERLDTPDRAIEAGQEHPALGSGFSDEKLYRARAYSGDGFSTLGPDEVLHAETRR